MTTLSDKFNSSLGLYSYVNVDVGITASVIDTYLIAQYGNRPIDGNYNESDDVWTDSELTSMGTLLSALFKAKWELLADLVPSSTAIYDYESITTIDQDTTGENSNEAENTYQVAAFNETTLTTSNQTTNGDSGSSSGTLDQTTTVKSRSRGFDTLSDDIQSYYDNNNLLNVIVRDIAKTLCLPMY